MPDIKKLASNLIKAKLKLDDLNIAAGQASLEFDAAVIEFEGAGLGEGYRVFQEDEWYGDSWVISIAEGELGALERLQETPPAAPVAPPSPAPSSPEDIPF